MVTAAKGLVDAGFVYEVEVGLEGLGLGLGGMNFSLSFWLLGLLELFGTVEGSSFVSCFGNACSRFDLSLFLVDFFSFHVFHDLIEFKFEKHSISDFRKTVLDIADYFILLVLKLISFIDEFFFKIFQIFDGFDGLANLI